MSKAKLENLRMAANAAREEFEAAWRSAWNDEGVFDDRANDAAMKWDVARKAYRDKLAEVK